MILIYLEWIRQYLVLVPVGLILEREEMVSVGVTFCSHTDSLSRETTTSRKNIAAGITGLSIVLVWQNIFPGAGGPE